MTDSNDVAEFEALATSIADHLALKLSGFVGSGAFKHTFRVETHDRTSSKHG